MRKRSVVKRAQVDLICPLSSLPDGIQVLLTGPRPGTTLADAFAAVVATSTKRSPGDAFVCLHVCREDDGEFSFDDGIFATDGDPICVGRGIKWPELHNALSRPVKGFEGLTNRRVGEPGHVRLKVFAEDRYPLFSPPDPNAGYGVLTLKLLKEWNRWGAEGATYNARAIAVEPGLEKATARIVISAADNLRKFCRKIDLHKKRKVDFRTPWRKLIRVLLLAEQLDARLRSANE